MIDLRTLLPSEARRQLTRALLERIEGSPLNVYQNPSYTFADALRDFAHEDSGARGDLVAECFREALATYERLHPKGWDNEKQRAFRS